MLIANLGLRSSPKYAKVLVPHNLGHKYVIFIDFFFFFIIFSYSLLHLAAGSHDLSQAEKRITVV